MRITAGMVWGVLLGGSVLAADHFGELGSGGGRVTNGSCAMDLGIGGIAGTATVVSPPIAMNQGYVGQLYDSTGFHLDAPARFVNAATAIPLGGAIELDDGTVLAVVGSEIAWNAVGHLWFSIASDGTALATLVDHDVATVVTGSYRGTAFTMPFYVLDTTPGHFDIVSITNRSTNLSLYLPSSPFRTYTLESTMDLMTGGWTSVSGMAGRPGDGSVLALSDTNRTPRRLYRVRIFPP